MKYKAIKLAMGVVGSEPNMHSMVERAINKEAAEGWTYHSMETFSWTKIQKKGCGPFKTSEALPPVHYYVLIFQKDDLAQPARPQSRSMVSPMPKQPVSAQAKPLLQAGDNCVLIDEVETEEYICHAGETCVVTIPDSAFPEVEFEGELRLRCPIDALKKVK